MLDRVRGLVFALVLGVSSVGPTVCEVVCSLAPAGAHEHHDEARAHTDDLQGALLAVAPVEDHDCQHPDTTPAVVTASRLSGQFDHCTAALPAIAVLGGTATGSYSTSVFLAWSSPHSPPPIISLRI